MAEPTTLLGAIELSASNGGDQVNLAGSEHVAEAHDLISCGVAEVHVGAWGEAILIGHDPEDRLYRVRLVDVYAHELGARL